MCGSCWYVERTVSLNCCQHNMIDLGASGCGKSTIIQLLERFYDVGHGQLVSIFLIDSLSNEMKCINQI